MISQGMIEAQIEDQEQLAAGDYGQDQDSELD